MSHHHCENSLPFAANWKTRVKLAMWLRRCSTLFPKIQKNKNKEERKMRVFKIGLGVLALTLGFAGAVKAESMPDKDIVEVAASARLVSSSPI